MNLKFSFLWILMLMIGLVAKAQTDPVIFTVNGEKVSRSEFEYAYRKAGKLTTGKQMDKKAFLEEYINHKLKVQAAKAAHLDETENFKAQMADYRSLLAGKSVGDDVASTQPLATSSSDIESEARREYAKMRQLVNGNGGLVRCGQILIRLNQHASYQEEQRVKNLAANIYEQLRNGSSFEELAKRYSDDAKTKQNGGMFPLVMRGQLVQEVENRLFAMQPGEIGEPVLSPLGYHIIKVIGREEYPAYDKVKDQIVHRLVVNNLRRQIVGQQQGTHVRLNSSASADSNSTNKNVESNEVVLPSDKEQMYREIYEGLLVDEISRKMFGKGIIDDEASLNRYFKKNKKQYKGATKALVGKHGKLLKPKKMEEVRQLVAADLHKSLEDFWLKELRKKYKVVIKKKNFSNIK